MVDTTRAALDEAIALVADPSARVRLGGLQRLVDLADRHDTLRPAVVRVLGAYLRRPPEEAAVVRAAPAAPRAPRPRAGLGRSGSGRGVRRGVPARTTPAPRAVVGKAARNAVAREARAEADVRRAVLAMIRDRLRDPQHPATWCGLDVDLRDTTLAGDLSGVVVTGGALRLDRSRVPAGETLDLGGAEVTGGLLSVDRVTVAGRLDAGGLRVDGGDASFDHLVVPRAGEVVLDRARAGRGGTFLRHAEITGLLSLRRLEVCGGTVSLHDCTVRGDVRLDDLEVDSGTLHIGTATVDGGALRLDDARLFGGSVSLSLTAVRSGVLGLDGVRLLGGTMRLDGLVVEPGADVRWGPFDPVEPAPPAHVAGVHDLDLRGPAPDDPWAWLRDGVRRRPRESANAPCTEASRSAVPRAVAAS